MRLFKEARVTPCCGQRIKVTRLEPDVAQERKCSLCGRQLWFVLKPMDLDPELLRLHWVEQGELDFLD